MARLFAGLGFGLRSRGVSGSLTLRGAGAFAQAGSNDIDKSKHGSSFRLPPTEVDQLVGKVIRDAATRGLVRSTAGFHWKVRRRRFANRVLNMVRSFSVRADTALEIIKLPRI